MTGRPIVRRVWFPRLTLEPCAMVLAPFYLLRALWLWIGVRLIGSAVMAASAAAAGGDAAMMLEPGFGHLAMFTLATVAAGFADVRRRGERALLGNFGVSDTVLAVWLALPALLGEAAVMLAWSARR